MNAAILTGEFVLDPSSKQQFRSWERGFDGFFQHLGESKFKTRHARQGWLAARRVAELRRERQWHRLKHE
jgi:hypothetical protein